MTRLIYLFAMALLFTVPSSATPAEWKGEGWNRTDFSRSVIQWPEILSGGPSRDGIPPIDDPQFTAVSQNAAIAPADPVISIEINGDARAYPLSILIWHEIVNDTVGGTPVAVTFCPLCNASIAFDRRLDGVTLDFGTTGKLRHSDLVMYDRQTESWWQQFTGDGIVGDHTGKTLKILPARIEAYSDFAARHPLGKVLVPNDPSFRDYGHNPYAGYDTSASPFLFRGEMPEGIDPMARVVIIRRANAAPVIVALELVRRKGALDHDGFTMSWRPGQSSAMDTSVISKGRDVGTVSVLEMATGKAVAYDVVFAFAAHAFYPGTTILKE